MYNFLALGPAALAPGGGETAAAVLVASLFFITGLALTMTPFTPGSFLVWLGIVVYRLWLGDAGGVPWWFVFVSGVLVLIVYLFDLVSGMWGAKKFGATWRGALGAFLGGLVGLFIPPIPLWLLLGPVLGAVVGELLGGRALPAAGKAGLGTIVGAVVAFLFKITLTICVIGWFYILVI